MMESMHSEDQARRAAKRVGLQAWKSRWRKNTIDNRGGFQIRDPMRNLIVAAEKFNYTGDDVAARNMRSAEILPTDSQLNESSTIRTGERLAKSTS